METEFIYWRHPTPPGIKVEEISGGQQYKGRIWEQMALQVYAENGKGEYRDIGHFPSGAPFLHGEASRISVSHCRGLYVVATLPPTPETDLSSFSVRSAMGVDAEPADRSQVLDIRGRFLSPEEQELIPLGDVPASIQAWTIKEAAYKAAMQGGVDLRNDIRIIRMPPVGPPVPVFSPADFGLDGNCRKWPSGLYGTVEVRMPGREPETFNAYSYLSDTVMVSLCFSPKCAKFGKGNDSK